jgi:GR25 family glycosyltransferase involved in LPS biosynthesis
MQNEIFKVLKEYDVNLFKILNDEHNINFINSHLNNIYVINLNDNVLRRNYIIILMKKYGINFNLVVTNRNNDETYRNMKNINEDLTREEIGCCISHLWCLKHAIKNKHSKFIIFEDDIIFHKKFLELFEKTVTQKEYDLLLLGRCDFNFNKFNSKYVKNNLYRPHPNTKMLYGAHANYYSLEGAKKIFDFKTNHFSFFDNDYLSIFKHFPKTSYICYPNFVVTDLSTSNLNHTYFLLTNMEKNYYMNCFDHFNFQDYHFIYLDIIEKYKDVPVNKEDNYESYMNKLLECYFFTDIERDEIKNRIVKNFFTLKDILLLKSFL